MIRIRDISLPPDGDMARLVQAAARQLRISPNELKPLDLKQMCIRDRASSGFWFGGCLSCIALRSITRIKTARSSCGWPGDFMGLRADDAVGLELFFGDDVHVGHFADTELFGQAVVVEAGAAGQDLDALADVYKRQPLYKLTTFFSR